MKDEAELRRRLTKLLSKTADAGAILPPVHWVGDAAEERRIRDDSKFGRLNWRSAYNAAKLGINALEHGDINLATEFWEISQDFYVAALEARISETDKKRLSKSAEKRGRPPAPATRDENLFSAVEEQLAKGLEGPAARDAAIKSSPELKTAFGNLSDAAVRKVLRKMEKLKPKSAQNF